MNGLLNLDKPAGMTSRDVVNHVQRLVRPVKVGHAGTLDPLAEGVLIVCLGAATRLIQYVQRMPKRYLGTFLLGRRSPTDDVEGEVELLADAPVPDHAAVVAAARQWLGQLDQRPPAFSALKVGGRRAYDLARRGEQVELAPRPVTIYRLEVVAYAYPELTLDIQCSGGTYVRSLGRDLAESLGTAAVMSALTRTAIGDFRRDEAVALPQLTSATLAGHLLPPLRAVAALPQLQLTDAQGEQLRRGQSIAVDAAACAAAETAALDTAGRLTAILVPRGPGWLGPAVNLPP